ncbi:hypothetical protein [Halanaerobium salsuginis]|uniref:Uncharacterized protein n=1 Tax=Halanaerobium salsuginis TaxID=29563 RepID=A0A1I4EW34_9FIRM|nr:hypothetical protein [Halanaerobium salsuginis]SFL09884.1 hypothetical protein SAMN02983006_00179 [Halanaerobium salsuginis]
MGLTVEDAVKTAKAAVEWSGENNLSYRTYEKYRKKFGGPSIGFILKRFKWAEFKSKYLGIEKISARERMIKKLEDNFCGHCKEKKDCNIELENCDHWEYWQSRKRVGG